MSDSSIADCGRPWPAIVQQTLELWPKCPPWPELSCEEHAALTAWLQSQSGQLRELARQTRDHEPNPFSFSKWSCFVLNVVLSGWDMRLLKAVQAVEDRLAYEDALRLVRDEDLERAIVPQTPDDPAPVGQSESELKRAGKERIGKKRRRMTGMTDGEEKILSALLKHHGYPEIDKPDPIAARDLANKAGVSLGLVSKFFERYFRPKDARKNLKGHQSYQILCNNPTWLKRKLQGLAGDVPLAQSFDESRYVVENEEDD